MSGRPVFLGTSSLTVASSPACFLAAISCRYFIFHVRTLLSFSEWPGNYLEKWQTEAVTPYSAACSAIIAFSSEVKCSHTPCLDTGFLFDWLMTHFTLFAATILDEGILVDRWPSGFGSRELLRWKYFSSDRKLSLMAPKLWNSRKFSPSKVSRYMVSLVHMGLINTYHALMTSIWTASHSGCPHGK